MICSYHDRDTDGRCRRCRRQASAYLRDAEGWDVQCLPVCSSHAVTLCREHPGWTWHHLREDTEREADARWSVATGNP